MNEIIADIHDKVILITGAAQGIGEATARLCAQRGARVVLADLKAAQGEAVAEAIRQAGGQATFYPLDVRQEAAVQEMCAGVQGRYGHVDVLICAAGVLQGAFLQPEEFPLETFEFVLDVHLKGVFLAVKYALPLLTTAKRGVILLIGSGAGVIGGSSSLAYGASKGAVNGLGMTLERHLAPRGIRVNVVCPGNIETELRKEVIRAAAEEQGQSYEAMAATATMGDPLGVARLLAYLASDEADYVRRILFTR